MSLHPAFARVAFGLLAAGCLLPASGTSIAAQSPASNPAQPRPSAVAGPGAQTPARPADKDLAQDLETLRGLWPGGRYRITPGDVLELSFPYVPEFNQTVTVQPDGYVALRGIDDVAVAGRAVAEVRREVTEAYAAIVRDPVITIVLKEFEKPYFIAAGELARPGRYELRGATTLTQALAVAGGPTSSAKKSKVVLFRRYGNELVEVKLIDVQKMYKSRNLNEDPILRPGDTLFIPKSRMASIAPWIPKPGIGLIGPF